MLQNVFLFHGTVRENIAFDARVPAKRRSLRRPRWLTPTNSSPTCRMVHDTIIGERGVKLSG